MNISNQRMKLNSEYITNCVCIMVHWLYLSRQFALTGQYVFIIFAIYGHWPNYSFSGTWFMWS